MCPSPRPHRKTSVSVRLPSPAGRGGDLCSLRSQKILYGRGDFAAIKGAKKYPTLLITCLPKNSPLLYIRSILAEVRNQYKYNEFNYNWGKYSTVMIYKLNGRIIPPLLLHTIIFIFPVGWKKVSYPRY